MQGRKIGDCHQFAPLHDPRNKALSLKRIGWLYPIFHDLHSYDGLLGRISRRVAVRGGHAGMLIHRASQRTVGQCPCAFAKINGAATVRERSVPLKSLACHQPQARPRESNPPGFSTERSVNAAASQLPPTAANLSSCEESHEQTATPEERPNWTSAPRNPKSPYLKEGAPVP